MSERAGEIHNTLNALRAAWPLLSVVLNERIEAATKRLIAENNDETRGRIKALLDLLDLPEQLQHELSDTTAELPETDSANQ